MLLIVAGTLGVLGYGRPSGTAMLISAPLAPHQDSRPPAEMPSSGPRSVAVEDKARAERFLLRGEEYLANGNVIAARAFFEQAAEAGLAAGALRLAATYDPGELQRLQALSVIPDRALARMWYERARELGAQESVKGLARRGGD